jgi:sec-independent protein translocase protein TatA
MIFKRSLPVLVVKIDPGYGVSASWSDAFCWTAGGRSPLLSPADVLIIGAVALIAFGPDQLPKVARKAGQVMRDVQNTSQSFIREMERAADEPEQHAWTPPVAAEPVATPAESERGVRPLEREDRAPE